MKALPMKKRKELMGSLKLREFLHKEIGISQTNDVRMKVVEDSGDEDLINSVLSGEVSLRSAFRFVKGGDSEDRNNLKNEIKKSIENSKDELSFHDVISIVEEVYRKK